MKVVYDGKPRTELDKAIKDAVWSFGFELFGSGYNFLTGERDLAFEKKEKSVKERPPRGVMPEELFNEELEQMKQKRIVDLAAAIRRRIGNIKEDDIFDFTTVPWMQELVRLIGGGVS